MNPDAQRIAILKSIGWKELDFNGYGILTGRSPKFEEGSSYVPAPNPLTDLNVMHDIEEDKFASDDWIKYTDFLKLTEAFPLIHATAADRAEAYLKTLGKWEGGSDES